MRKLVTIFSPAYNEERNVERCYREVAQVMSTLSERFDYEHIFADNCSEDRTLEILKKIASRDERVKVLSYSRNFGSEKSGFTMLRFARGDAAICVVSDLQDPPALIPTFLDRWEQGFPIVYGIYENHGDGWVTKRLRRLFYSLMERLSEERIPPNFSGFGLFDRKVIDEVVRLEDHAPFIRGMIASVGFPHSEVPYRRQGRELGQSKQGWRFLLGFGMNAIISHSLVPLRLATFMGMLLSGIAVLLSIAYLITKLVNWSFQAPGATTTIVLLLFFSGIQLLFLGVLGEYIGAIHAQVRRKPFVVIKEKINFDVEP